MATQQKKLSGVGKRLQNKWDYDQKLTLRIMFTEFELTVARATTVFNTLHAEHLKSCGFLNGLQNNAINSQWGMRRKEPIAKDWAIIISDAADGNEARKRERFSDRISGILTSLGVAHRRHLNQAPPSPVVPTSSVLKKRARAVSQIRSYIFDDSEDELNRPTKKKKSTTARAMVVVPRKEQNQAKTAQARWEAQNKAVTPSTPKSANSRRPDATIPYPLPSGTTVWLTPKQFQETQGDLVPVGADLAHPYAPLLFRYWNEDCMSPLNEKGFTAGRFATTIIPPPGPPSLQTFPWSCAAQHLNRDEKVASPFISTSNNFVWITRLALKQMKGGAIGGRISLINPELLDRGGVYHAQPIHRELCKKKPFDKGAFLYHGMNEFLVWASIPKEAIIHTFPVEMLLHVATSNPGVGELLRVDRLGMLRTGYHSTLLPSFKLDDITIGKESIRAVARICRAMGLDSSMVEPVGSLVCDIVKGLGLNLQPKSQLGWQAAASIFSDAMCSPGSSLTLRNGMGYAFLDGCRWGVGEFNARLKPKHMKTMMGKASRIGLESPSQILKAELDEARAAIAKFDQTQRSLLRGASSQALLRDADEDDQDASRLIDEEDYDSDEIVVSPRPVRRRLFSRSERIIYDFEEEED